MKKRLIISILLVSICASIFANTTWYGKENFENKLENKNALLFILKGTLEPSYGCLGLFEYANEKGIYPDGIICQGTGILPSLLYASGYSVEDVVRIIENAPLNRLINSRIPINQTILDMHQVVSYFKEYIDYENIEDLPIAFAYVELDLVENETITIASGTVSAALKAAFSYPVVGDPTIFKGRFLVDGAIFNIEDYLEFSDKIILFDAYNDDKNKNLYDPLVAFVRFNYRKPLNTDKVLSISYAGDDKQISYLNVRKQYENALKHVSNVDEQNNYISLVEPNLDKRVLKEVEFVDYKFNQNFSDNFVSTLSIEAKDFSKTRYLDPNLGLGLSYNMYFKSLLFGIDTLAGYQTLISYIPTLYFNMYFNVKAGNSVVFELNNSYNFRESFIPEAYFSFANRASFEILDNELDMGYTLLLEHLYNPKKKKSQDNFKILYTPSINIAWHRHIANVLEIKSENTIATEINDMFSHYDLYLQSKLDLNFDFGIYFNTNIWSRVALNHDDTNLYIKDDYITKFKSESISIPSKFLIASNFEIGYVLPHNVIIGETIQFTNFKLAAYSNILYDNTGFYGVSCGGKLGFSTTVFGVSQKDYALQAGYDTHSKKLTIALSL